MTIPLQVVSIMQCSVDDFKEYGHVQDFQAQLKRDCHIKMRQQTAEYYAYRVFICARLTLIGRSKPSGVRGTRLIRLMDSR